MTAPKGNSKFYFPETFYVSRGEAERNIEVEGEQNSLIPAGPVTKCFVIPPNSKLEKTAKKSFALRRLAYKFAAVLRSTTCSRASRKFMLLFPMELVSFDPRHVIRFPPIRKQQVVRRGDLRKPPTKRIWVGRFCNVASIVVQYIYNSYKAYATLIMIHCKKFSNNFRIVLFFLIFPFWKKSRKLMLAKKEGAKTELRKIDTKLCKKSNTWLF